MFRLLGLLAVLTLKGVASAEEPAQVDLATTEISGFSGLEEVPVASLKVRLIPEDPRWDPWLEALLLDQRQPVPELSVDSPRFVAGVALLSGGMLFALLVALSSSRRRWRPWLSCAAVFTIGLVLVTSGGGGNPAQPPPSLAELYRHHLWFQAAFPYGGTWHDYAPGKPINLPEYRRSAGRLVEEQTPVVVPDAAWEGRWLAQISERNVARSLALGVP